MKLVSTLAMAGLFAAAGAQAMDFSDMYIGGNIGRSTVAIPDNAMGLTGVTAQSLSKNSNDTSFKIFGGAQVLDFLAVEGGYANLGSFSTTRTAKDAGNGATVTFTGAGKTQGVYADGVGSYAINSSFSLLARLGYGYYWTSWDNSATGFAYTPTSGKSVAQGFQYGLGAQFNMSKQIALRAEWDRKPSSYVIAGEKVSIDNVSLGMLYKF